MADRAKQGVVKHALAPAGEAHFAPNSDGVRPGRSPWEAIGAIDVQSNQQPPGVLDAAIAKGCDRLDHAALVRKRDAPPTGSRQNNAWLKAGVLDQGHWSPTTAGTPQGGVASPVVAPLARHGWEELIQRAFPGRGAPAVIRDAAALVGRHPVRESIEQCQALLAEHWRGMGWEGTPRQTRSTHTLKGEAGVAGCDFLGVHLRPYPTPSKRGDKTISKPSRRAMAQHQRQIVERVRRYRLAGQARVMAVRNPMLRGGRGSCSTVCSTTPFAQMDDALRQQWRAWSRVRHPHKHRKWGQQRDWRREDGRRPFTPRGSGRRVAFHVERPIRRHVKGQARRSPYDGDEGYGSTRRGHSPGVSTRVAPLLKRPAGKCRSCGGSGKADDVLDVEHLIPRAAGGREAYTNWPLVHRDGHVAKTARERRRFA